MIYKKSRSIGWKRVCQLAGIIDEFQTENEIQILAAIKNKWLSTASSSYFSFILKLAKKDFNIRIDELSEIERSMALMLHYDLWLSEGGFKSLEDSINQIGKNKVLVEEIIELLEVLIDNIDFKEFEIDLPYQQPLKLHAQAEMS